MKERWVCDLCGLPGNRYCPNRTRELYVPKVTGPVTTEICQVMQKVVVDGKEQIIAVWPSELAAFLHRHGMPVAQVPAYQAQQMAGERYFAPVIQSPVAGAVYIRRHDQLTAQEQQIKLQGATTNRVKRVKWYLDDKLIADSDQPYVPIYISPPAGEYVVTLVDDTGGSDSVVLTVEDYRAISETGSSSAP
ncbi:hypothetical protein [Bacterioplanes sanyensis]|uniref:hypothetical protein n=1 Tax=Bacterioplanes sanyensis TaxID=1249553 RepID=UPI0012FD2BE0|nr:hypothetical protein [Bacterioplanes sanyensis]